MTLARSLLPLAIALSGSALAGPIVINEFMPDPAGADAGHEWIELYNTSGAAVDIGGWEIERAKTSWGLRYTIPSGTTIAGMGFLVIGETQVASADLVVPDGKLDLGNASSNGDGVRLMDDTWSLVDVVIYGPNNDDDLDDDWGVVTSLAPKPVSGQSLARIPDGYDTNDSGVDFQVRPPTPGQPNEAPPADCDTAGVVVINEFLPDPAGADGEVLREWVELYASSSVDLTGWSLQIASQADNHKTVLTFDEQSMSAGGFLLVGETNVAGAHVRVDLLGMYSGSGGDAVRLVDCAGDVVDTVVYGGDNGDGLRDDSGAVATSIAPKAGADRSIARRHDGVDTDRSGDDFHVLESPTPGAPNPTPPACTPSAGGIVINELLPDPAGTDSTSGAEFVELYNATGGSVDLGGWALVAASKADDWDPDLIMPAGTVIHPEGFVVFGGANVAGAILTDMALPNGSGGDALRLLDCEGALVDVVVYGNDNEDGFNDESGALADPVPKPSSDWSIARIEDGVDTDSRDDWFLDATPTPGASNYQEPVEFPPGGGGGGRPGGGCGQDRGAPGAGAPDGGCSTAPGPRGILVLVAMFAAARRRR